jgi:hypothetical protein
MRKGAPVVGLGVDVGVGGDQTTDGSAIAAVRRQVQRGESFAVHGGAWCGLVWVGFSPTEYRYPTQ